MTQPTWMTGVMIVVLATAGCLDPPRGPDVETAPDLPPALRAANQTAALRLQTLYSASAGGVQVGDMQAVVYADVPTNATNVTLVATWSGGAGVGDRQHCMLHDGTGQSLGPMLASGAGPQPLRVGPTNLTALVKTIGVMCWVDGDPTVYADRVTSLQATFGLWIREGADGPA